MAWLWGLVRSGGQILGGLLVHTDIAGLSWRACFLVNVPVGVAALLLVGTGQGLCITPLAGMSALVASLAQLGTLALLAAAVSQPIPGSATRSVCRAGRVVVRRLLVSHRDTAIDANEGGS